MPDRTASPLLITDDDHLIDDLGRLAAAAGVVPDLARDLELALGRWTTARAVIIGADLAAPLAATVPVRRSDVYVVARGPVPDELFRPALECGAGSVLALPEGEARVVELFADLGDGSARSGVIVGVLGSVGGVGVTTLAAALSLVLAEQNAQRGVLLIDADAAGAGIELVLGADEISGVRWDGLVRGAGRFSARSLRETLPGHQGVSLLTWPADRSLRLPEETLRQVLAAARRGFGVVVVDLPRCSDEVSAEVLARCDHVLLVSTMTVPAITAAARVARNLPPSSRVLLRGPAGGLSDAEVETLLGLPVRARMGDQRRLDEAVSLGLGPLRSGRGPLARTARLVADALVTDGIGSP